MESDFTANNAVADIYIEDGILFFIYQPNIHLSLQLAKDAVTRRLSVQKDKAYPVFCDVRGLASSDKVARDYLAREGSVLVKAVSFLAKDYISLRIIKFYMSNDIHGIPSRIFTQSYHALKFLQQFK